MNKKIKLGLLATLFAGSALAITLPIVSCSGSTTDPTATTLTVTTGDATALAKLATDLGGKGTAKITEEQFNTIKALKYEGTTKTAVDAYLTFKDEAEKVITDAIESIKFEGTWPSPTAAGVDAILTLKVTLKNTYTVDTANASKLTINLIVGKSMN